MGIFVFGLLLVSVALQGIFLFRRTQKPDPVSRFITFGVFVLLAAMLVYRSFQIDFVAVTSIYESLILFSALLAGITALYGFQRRYPRRPVVSFGATVLSLIFFALASSPLAPSEALPPIPALQSGWLVLHVTLAFLGEAFFAVAFVAAIAYLVTGNQERREELNRVMHTSVVVGYPVFTAGALIFGAVWAEKAWGSYWSWDPKETWALVTWLVYTAYLHLRLYRGRRSPAPPILLVVGFLFTLFTFLGVNYLLPGLHSYG